MISIQYVSDIHLEFYKLKCMPIINACAPYIAICGDIGYVYSDIYGKFISKLSNDFKMVFVVAGNHEYYRSKHNRKTMEQINLKLLEICNKHKNVYYMQNKIVALDSQGDFLYYDSSPKETIPSSYIIAGTTLWTHIPPEKYMLVRERMNDYSHIFRDLHNNIFVGDVSDMNQKNVKWIREVISQCKNSKIVMLTHHSPSREMLDPKFKSDNLSCCYANELDELIKDPIVAWISGHTHHCVDKLINGVLCTSNCMGYINDINVMYKDKVISI
jgi:predicted MPP superfamily phosphohydrolase